MISQQNLQIGYILEKKLIDKITFLIKNQACQQVVLRQLGHLLPDRTPLSHPLSGKLRFIGKAVN